VAFEGCRFAIKAATISLAIGIVGATSTGKCWKRLAGNFRDWHELTSR
jgi:hypothetical protein